MGCPRSCFLLDLGGQKRGQKRPFLGGPKSPILARGHMGKTAVFNQIVLYLEPPNLDHLPPFSALRGKPHPIKQRGPWDRLRRCKTLLACFLVFFFFFFFLFFFFGFGFFV